MSYHFAEPGRSEIGSKVSLKELASTTNYFPIVQVFFFKAQWRSGKVNINSDKLEDYAWVTKKEMQEFVSKDFYKAIEPVLLD